LSEIESGIKYPAVTKFDALATALGVERSELLVDANISPFSDVIDSTFLALFQGDSPQEIVNFITSASSLADVIMRATYQVAETHGLDKRNFLFPVLLRAYQERNNNYFKGIEEKAEEFLSEFGPKYNFKDYRVNYHSLRDILKKEFRLQVKEDNFEGYEKLKSIRSIYVPRKDTLLINRVLDENQKAFEIGREIGHKYLSLSKERDIITPIMEIKSFGQIWNEFQASYFSGALLMPQKQIAEDIKSFFNCEKLNRQLFHDIMRKYNITEEMILHRMTQIMYPCFNMKNLHFMRFQHSGNYRLNNVHKPPTEEPVCSLTKYLNINSMAVLYEDELHERYCRRWGSIKALKNIIEDNLRHERQSDGRYFVVQRSKFIASGDLYICISLSRRSKLDESFSSITIGFPLNSQAKSVIRFWNDESIEEYDVGYTCERCQEKNCNERVALPTVHDNIKEKSEIINDIKRFLTEKYNVMIS